MEYSFTEQRDMIFVYGVADGNAEEARRIYAERYPNRICPIARTFVRIYQRLGETGQLGRNPANAGAPRRVRTVDFEEAVLDHFENQPSTSTRSVGHMMDVSNSVVWEVLHEDGQHPFSIQKIQDLTPLDYPLRVDFSQEILARTQVEPDFPAIVLFTDESCFTRDGIYNTRNFHVWSRVNPHASRIQGNQHRFSVNLWAGVIGDHLIGPHRLPARLNGATYLEFLQESLPALLERVPLNIRQRMWYQHDGAPAHYTRNVREYLQQIFQGRVIGRGATIPWPPRSPDLTPPDFFVWGFYKNAVYDPALGPVMDEADLLRRIDDATESLRALALQGTLEQTLRNFVRRCHACIDANGRQFEHLL